MSYALIKTGVTMLSLTGVALGVAYIASVPTAAGAAGVFLLGWLNGIGDGVLQW